MNEKSHGASPELKRPRGCPPGGWSPKDGSPRRVWRHGAYRLPGEDELDAGGTFH